MTFASTKHREKLFSAHSAESNFSFNETKFRDKYSRWMSCDPAVSDYIPADAESAKKLPAGGVYTLNNLSLYHYSNNNPIKYVDPDGQIIELAKGTTEAQKKEYDAAINYLKTSDAGAQLINKLDSRDELVVICFNEDHQDQHVPYTGSNPVATGDDRDVSALVNWDPTSGLPVGDDESGGVQSAAMGLAHELIHALETMTDGNSPEESATQRETKIADQLGEPTRKNHDDVPRTEGGELINVRMGNSTEFINIKTKDANNE